jgi:hypothetical protein
MVWFLLRVCKALVGPCPYRSEGCGAELALCAAICFRMSQDKDAAAPCQCASSFDESKHTSSIKQGQPAVTAVYPLLHPHHHLQKHSLFRAPRSILWHSKPITAAQETYCVVASHTQPL